MNEGKNVETVKIRVPGQDGPATINKSDFNDKTQQLYTEPAQKPTPLAEPAKKLEVVKKPAKAQAKGKTHARRAA